MFLTIDLNYEGAEWCRICFFFAFSNAEFNSEQYSENKIDVRQCADEI
jgi:hypothetical protein